MATYVLIHGAWHGGWCWERIAQALEAAGHRVIAPDLNTIGTDRSRANEGDLSRWADFTADLLRAQEEPVILVGHSRGGIVISESAERVPERIRMLVYVSAYLVANGESLATTSSKYSPRASPLATSSADGLTTVLTPATARSNLYQLTREADFNAAVQRFVPDPVQSRATPLHLSPTRFGRVPRAYIEALEDRAIPLATQRAMQATLPCDPVWSIHSDHAPFYSAAAELAAALLALAQLSTLQTPPYPGELPTQ
jgi:pimeloyl-ACP methyl ester carboxylesterase